MFNRNRNRQSLLRFALLLIFGVVLGGSFLAGSAHAQLAGVTDDKWTGAASANWSNTGNWSLGAVPGPNNAVRFDQLSAANLNMNQDIPGLSISGIVNTSLAANNGPAGPMTITGQPMTIGATGIINISGNPLGPYGYTSPAQADITVDVDLTLSADQRWKAGGPGTATTAQPAGNQAVIVGASPNSHTVTLNGFKPTLTVISNQFDMVIVNSKLVDGSVPSKVGISKYTGNTAGGTFDSGNINAATRIRISGDNTYSGGTDIIGGRQIIQLQSSSVTSGGAIVSGPFGTGAITISTESLVSGTINNQNPYFTPFGADRIVANDINLNNVLTSTGSTPIQSFPSLYNSGSSDDTGAHALTLNGAISVPTSASLLQNSQLGGTTSKVAAAGDLTVNGTILLGGADFNSDGKVDAADYVSWRSNSAARGGADGYRVWVENFGNTIPTPDGNPTTTGKFSIGQTGSPGAASGRSVYNGNILQTNAIAYTLTVDNGTGAFPTVVRLAGQNTFSATSISAAAPTSTTGDANIQIASSSVLSGPTIVSGPLGTGTVTITSSAGSAIEAFGAARTVDNPFNLSTNQSNLLVQGTQDLTLNGVISGTATLTMNGTGKLILNGANTYVGGGTGASAVNSGTLLVNGSVATVVNVAAGATLGGTGTISNDINNSGTLAPGVSGVGTLTSTANVTDSAGAIWNIDLSGASSDKLVVGGGLTLAGDTLNITGPGSGGNWVIATYTGALTGTFGTITPGFSVNYGTGLNSQITLTAPGSGAGLAGVPEPTAALLLAMGLAIGSLRRSR